MKPSDDGPDRAKTPTGANPLDWLSDELRALDENGLRRRRVTRSGPQLASTTIDGRRLVNFSSNDYLNLAADPRLGEAAAQATREAGWGAGASPLVTGRGEWHARLEARLAEFEGAEAALLFPSGFAANSGIIPALVDAGDAVFGDAKNHASIIDGCRLSRADRFIYPHNDVDALDRLLTEHVGYRRRLIVTDSLFSMDGDLAPIDRLAELAARHSAMLMVDEAHATGVWGPNGRGAVEHFNTANSLPNHDAIIRVGTLSKALGSMGGFVVGSHVLIDWLANRARSYVFSTAAPAATAAAALAALDIVESEPERRDSLLSRAASLRKRLADDGWNTCNSQSQIIPILVGEPAEAMRLSDALREQGFLVPGIRPPSVPEGESLLRVSLCYGHSEDDIDRLVTALNELRT